MYIQNNGYISFRHHEKEATKVAKELYHRNPADYVPDSLRNKEKFKNPNNKVYLEGRIVEDLQIEYEFNNVKYYKTMIVVKII